MFTWPRLQLLAPSGRLVLLAPGDVELYQPIRLIVLPLEIVQRRQVVLRVQQHEIIRIHKPPHLGIRFQRLRRQLLPQVLYQSIRERTQRLEPVCILRTRSMRETPSATGVRRHIYEVDRCRRGGSPTVFDELVQRQHIEARPAIYTWKMPSTDKAKPSMNSHSSMSPD